jgi:hypothetical protein
MRPQTAALATAVRAASSPDDQVARLKGAYAGETVYLVACGPSLNDVMSPVLREFLRDKLVVAVKRAYSLLPEAVDFHLTNRCRHVEYEQTDSATMRLAVELVRFSEQVDIRLPFWHHPEQRWLHSVLFSRALEKWELSRGSTRAWGPGIMLELGIFLPVHLGCSKAVFLGWDMNPIDPTHYDVQNVAPWELEEHVIVSSSMPQFVPTLNAWWRSHGLEAYLCSPRSAIPLPQLTVDELLNDPAFEGTTSR